MFIYNRLRITIIIYINNLISLSLFIKDINKINNYLFKDIEI